MRTLVFAVSAVLFIVLIIVVFLALSIFRQPPGTTPLITAPTPLPFPTRTPISPAVEYDNQKSDQLVDSAKNRQQLSTVGQQTKQRLITQAGGSATVYTSPTLSIGYIEAPDLFQAEILSENIEVAKQEGINWMTSQGFSADDLCKLPFSFYLSPQVRSALEGENIIFNPLPEGC